VRGSPGVFSTGLALIHIEDVSPAHLPLAVADDEARRLSSTVHGRIGPAILLVTPGDNLPTVPIASSKPPAKLPTRDEARRINDGR
jgi:hypothetical protein